MDEQEKQNKHHKKNEKLDKKRKKDKELKKIKKLKKKAYELLKDKTKEEYFQQKHKKHRAKIDRPKALKAYKKLLKIYKDDLEDLFDVFNQLDDGLVIETAGIEDTNVRTRLEKLMKRLKVKNSGTEKDPQYKKKGDHKLQQYVRSMYDEVVHGVEYKESETSDSEEDSHQGSRSRSNEKQQKSHYNQQDKYNEMPMKHQKKQIVSDDPIEQQFQQFSKYDREQIREKLLEGHQKKEQGNYEEDPMEQMLNQIFNKVDKPVDNKLTQFLNHRQKHLPMQQQKPQQQTQQSDGKWIGGEAPKKWSQEEVRDYMVQYDQQFRSKSLLQLHQEKLQLEKDKKQQLEPNKKLKGKGRKEFNRETDLQGGFQESTNMIEEIRLKGTLTNKFGQGKYNPCT